jgi:hypothetical protein
MSTFPAILQIVRFREAGFAGLTATNQGFLNSLAPLLAFPLVGSIAGLIEGEYRQAVAGLLSVVVALLTPLVLTHAFARRWGREAAWLRFAVASNWSQCAIALAMIVLVSTMALFGPGAARLALLAVVIYGVAMHWFLARHGLGISRLRATLMVLMSDLATGALIIALGSLSYSAP